MRYSVDWEWNTLHFQLPPIEPDDVLALCAQYRVQVKFGLFWPTATRSPGRTIYLPDRPGAFYVDGSSQVWDYTLTKSIVLHEIAHILDSRPFPRPAHGSSWFSIYKQLLRDHNLLLK